MATITFQGNPVKTIGALPQIGSEAPHFNLVKSDLSTIGLDELKGKKAILNIFPSLDTGICAASVRKFNAEAAALENAVVLCISRDLPFAHKRFCVAEGIENVITASDFRDGSFGKDYGLTITGGAFDGLHSRAVVVVDENGKVVYTEQVPEIVQEPDYAKALDALK